MKFHIRGGREGDGIRNFTEYMGKFSKRLDSKRDEANERTNERTRMNACRTMDWLARASNDFIIYLGHDRFQCANRNCLLRRSGVVNVASSSSRREWQFVSPIKLIASVRDSLLGSSKISSKGVASSLILEKDDASLRGSSVGETETRFDFHLLSSPSFSNRGV